MPDEIPEVRLTPPTPRTVRSVGPPRPAGADPVNPPSDAAVLLDKIMAVCNDYGDPNQRHAIKRLLAPLLDRIEALEGETERVRQVAHGWRIRAPHLTTEAELAFLNCADAVDAALAPTPKEET